MQTITDTDITRDTAIRAIKQNLQKRSGKTWSVTGGKGTAWGWITVDAPPARRTWRHVKAGTNPETGQDIYEEVNDPSKPYGHTGPEERAELAKLMGLDSVHHQGLSIAAGRDYYLEYVERSAGKAPRAIAQPYWD
jgi:hypothetical protein